MPAMPPMPPIQTLTFKMTNEDTFAATMKSNNGNFVIQSQYAAKGLMPYDVDTGPVHPTSIAAFTFLLKQYSQIFTMHKSSIDCIKTTGDAILSKTDMQSILSQLGIGATVEMV